MKIVISGTSSGIGRHLAERLLAGGHEIWGLARSCQEGFAATCEAKGLRFRYSRCDISVWDSLRHAADGIISSWGEVDALVCGSGVQGPIGPAMEVSPEKWCATTRTNLEGTYFTIRALFEILISGKTDAHAKVLCFSGGGATSPRENFSAYGASKAAVVRLVETLAHEWRDLPIAINAIAPGAIHTRMTDEVLAAGSQAAGEKEFQTAETQLPNKAAALEKAGALVDFLLSEQSAGISGRLLSAPWDDWKSLPGHLDKLRSSDVFTLRRIVPEDRRW